MHKARVRMKAQEITNKQKGLSRPGVVTRRIFQAISAREMMVAGLLAWSAPYFGMAGETFEVPKAGVAYIDMDDDPERISAGAFGWNDSFALDADRRSLVVALKRPYRIDEIVLRADLPSQTRPLLTPDNVFIYLSFDNRHYHKWEKPVQFQLVQSKRPEALWTLRLKGLGFYARYIKIHTTAFGADYGFGIHNLQDMISLQSSSDPDERLEFAHLQAARFQDRNAIKGAYQINGPASVKPFVQLRLEILDEKENVVDSSIRVAEMNQWKSFRWTPRSLRPGPFTLVATLIRQGLEADAATRRIQVVSKIREENDIKSLQPGEAVIVRQVDRVCPPGQKLDRFSYSLLPKPAEIFSGIEVKTNQPLLLAVPVAGTCAVYLGVGLPAAEVSTKWNGRIHSIQAIGGSGDQVQEVLGGIGDFSAGSLSVSLGSGPASLTFVAIQCLDSNQKELALYQSTPGENRRVIYNNDGFSDFGSASLNRGNLLSQVERYRNTDAAWLDFCALVSGAVSYPSKYAEWFGTGATKWPREFDRIATENFKAFEKQGMPMFPTLAARGKEIGIPVWGSLRMSAYYPDDYGPIFNGELWKNHPEFRIKNKKGSTLCEMSFAHEPVRDQRIGVLGEMAEMGCAGVNLDFCRYPDVLGYEAPLVEEYVRMYGQDPRKLPDEDERWVRLRCETMNRFMRGVKGKISEIAKRLDRPVKISVRLPATGYRHYGFDPQTWVSEKLVDVLIPGFPGLDRPYDARPWVAMAAGSGIKVYGNIEATLGQTANTELTDEQIARGIKPGTSTVHDADSYRHRALELYNMGVDGIYIFNNWAGTGCLNLLGDERALKQWAQFEDLKNLSREIIATGAKGK